jgi:Tfp pilus assembly protein PilF
MVTLAGSLIVLIGIAAYHNSFSGALVYDDFPTIVDNPAIRQLWPILPPPTVSGVAGRPLASLTFALNYAFGGTEVWGYHAVNLIIHLCTGLALFGVVRRTLQRPVSEPAGASAVRQHFRADSLPLALAVAALWTVHPALTESVTYLSQRTESLMGLCYLLTLYGFIRGTEQVPHFWLSLSIAFCALGMASKEAMVTAPLAVLLYDRAFVAGTFRAAWRQRWRYYLGLGATWLLLAYLMTTGLGGRGVGYNLEVSWWNYALTECEAIVHYLQLSFWPHPLIFDYGSIYTGSVAAAAPYGLVLGCLLVGTALALRYRPTLGFAMGWFFLILAPTSSIVPVVWQPIAENRMYLPLAAVIALTVLGLYAWIGRNCFAVLLVLALGLGYFTAQRNETFHSRVTLYTDIVAKRPQNPRAHISLGNELVELGQVAGAITHFEQALRLAPDYADAYKSYGKALVRVNRTAEAIGYFERALRLKPDDADTHNNYGIALLRSGHLEAATAQFEQALRLKPDDADTRSNYGYVLLRLGRREEAEAQLEQALRLRPALAEAHNNCGLVLFQLGKTAGAVAHYEKALRLKPAFAEAHNNLGNALIDAPGRLEEAISHYQSAVRIKPDYAEAYFNLGIALLKTPDRQHQAEENFEAALRVRPDLEPARNGLAAFYAETGRLEAAVEQLEIAVRLNPASATIRDNLEKLKATRKQ